MIKTVLNAAGITALISASSIAIAAPVYYFNDAITDRASFQASAGALTLESFESPFSSSFNQSFTGFTVTSTATLSRETTNSRAITDGISALGFSEAENASLTFTFDNAITAFGVDVNDMNFGNMTFSDNIGNLFTDVLIGDNGTDAGGPGFTNHQFFGVTNSEAFTSITLSFTGASSSGLITVDRLEYSSVVPVPAAAWLFGSGLIGLFSLRRRKAKLKTFN